MRRLPQKRVQIYCEFLNWQIFQKTKDDFLQKSCRKVPKISLFVVILNPRKGQKPMLQKLQGVVLGTIKYNERHNIVRVYTDLNGLMSFLVPQGNTRGTRLRNAMTMPLSIISFVSSMRAGLDLGHMRDMQRVHALNNIYSDPSKMAIAMFISELLSHTIREQERNEGLFKYITTSVQLLETITDGVANFHICFMYHLGAYLGIMPGVETYNEGYWFDMQDGIFVPHPISGHRHLNPHDARVLMLLSRINFTNLHLFRLTREERNAMLDVMIEYYRTHHNAMGALRSPDVLKQLFV